MAPDKVMLFFLLLLTGGGFFGYGVFNYYKDNNLRAIIFIAIGILLFVYFILYGPDFSIKEIHI